MDTLGEKWLDYCLVEHRNTDYPHAHILAWSKSQVNQTERKQMYERVKELELVRDRERQQRIAQEQARLITHRQDREYDLGW